MRDSREPEGTLVTKAVFVLAILLLFAASVGFFYAPHVEPPTLVEPAFSGQTPVPWECRFRYASGPAACQ